MAEATRRASRTRPSSTRCRGRQRRRLPQWLPGRERPSNWPTHIHTPERALKTIGERDTSPEPEFFDPTFPSTDRDRYLVAILMDLVAAQPGLPEDAYADMIGLITNPERIAALLNGADARASKTVIRSAPKELVSRDPPIRWYAILRTLRANSSVTASDGQRLDVGPRWSDARQSFPDLAGRCRNTFSKRWSGSGTFARPFRSPGPATKKPDVLSGVAWSSQSARVLEEQGPMNRGLSNPLEIGRDEPSIWLSRLLILETAEPWKEIREVTLHRGLNIIWSNDEGARIVPY